MREKHKFSKSKIQTVIKIRFLDRVLSDSDPIFAFLYFFAYTFVFSAASIFRYLTEWKRKATRNLIGLAVFLARWFFFFGCLCGKIDFLNLSVVDDLKCNLTNFNQNLRNSFECEIFVFEFSSRFTVFGWKTMFATQSDHAIEKSSQWDDKMTLDFNFPLFNTRTKQHTALKVIGYGIVFVINSFLSSTELQSERDIEISAIDARISPPARHYCSPLSFDNKEYCGLP